MDYGLEGYGLYWYCLELIASKVDKDKVTFELEHDARVIARNAGSTPQKVEEMMRYFVSVGLFENAEGVISCLKMAKRLDKSMTSNNEMRKIIEGLAMNSTQLDGYVYFIEKRDSHGKVVAIKIGRSKNPTSRLSEISKLDENIGYKLEVICKVKSENCVSLETELHRKFKDFKIYNEWFNPDVVIYDLIKSDYVMITTCDDMQEEIRLEEKRIENKTMSFSNDNDVVKDEGKEKPCRFKYSKESIKQTWNEKASSFGLPEIRSVTDTVEKGLVRLYKSYLKMCKELGKEPNDMDTVINGYIRHGYQPTKWAMGENPEGKKYGIATALTQQKIDEILGGQ